MADVILSAVAERIVSLIEEQARYHVNLVRGAEKEVDNLAKELKTIGDVLDDAENRRFHDKRINRWLSRLEHTSYEMEDVLDEWDYALLKLKMQEHQSADAVAPSKQKVCSFIPSSSTSWCLCFKKVVVRHKLAKKILNVKAQLDEILEEKDRYSFVSSQSRADPLPESWRIQSTSLIDSRKVHGRDGDSDILVSKLMHNGEESGIRIVSIVGVGGIGKTTLAQLVYNDSRVEKYFDLRVWVCVSDPFNLAAIAKGILECIQVGSSPNTDQLEVLFKQVKESIFGKRFLLVLDDIWTEDSNKWEPLANSLMCGGGGSKVLVTTRNERVVKMMGLRDSEIYRLGLLSDEDCWLLLCRIALSGMNQVAEFEDIGKKIAKKCNGLPLATKTLGSLLRFKSRLEEWENILNSEIWKMEAAEVDIFPHLLLSYNELSPSLKRCFSYCAIFPKGSKIDVETLVGYWMALGYLGYNTGEIELKGRENFDVLAMRSLFQDFEKDDLDEIQSFKMHDIVHDFAQFVRKNGREHIRRNKTACRACDPLLVSSVNQFCTLFCEKETPILCDCLARLRVLILTNCGLPQLMENLIHLRLLSLFDIKLSCEELKIVFQIYNLHTLSLVHCNIKEIPREIENLSQLRYLDFYGNETLQELPREIGYLINLRCLNLGRNLSLKEYPREIGNLINLRDLKLCQNPLVEELPREIGNLIQLQHLDLSDNKSLKVLPKEIGKLIHLRYLNLRGNESLKELPREIGNLIHLRRLDLSENAFLKELPREIGKLIQLRYLNLRGNKSLKELPREIGKLIHLRLFNFSRNTSLEKLPREIGNLINLRRLDLSENEFLKELPREIGKLIHLRDLNLRWIKCLEKLPYEIGNLIHLKHLDLSSNKSLKELPREIGNLIHLKHLDLSWNASLEVPESICGLQELEILDCPGLFKHSKGLGQLTSLRSLREFGGGSGWNKLGLLKNLNNLSGTLRLRIKLAVDDDDEVIVEARKAEMRNKIYIEKLHMTFEDEMEENEWSSQVRMGVIDALEPHPNMQTLFIWEYKGFKFPLGWMVSPLNQLRNINLIFCRHLTSLPCLGKLPSLEKISLFKMEVLQYVGPEFLGITRGGDILNNIAFPKLKKLTFLDCGKWKEWEDITEEEEESAALLVMPCLTDLTINGCESLTALPHRMLRKASSLKLLKLIDSKVLQRRYTNRDDSDSRFIFQNNPCLQLRFE
ncbi:hypothetical protein ACS0TY_016969 [Phlomoides rotata]